MTRYAAATDVAVDRSQAEIRATLKRYGATGFAYAEDDTANAAMIVFRVANRHYRIYVPLPAKSEDRFRASGSNGSARRGQFLPTAYDQAVKQRWRAAALYIKATLEAVESGFITFERAFLAHTLLPNGQTVDQATAGAVEAMSQTGQMQPLLPGLTPRELPEGLPRG